jgi:hypothetical protein
MGYHRSQTIPKAGPTTHDADIEGPQRPSKRTYLLLVVFLVLPIPLVPILAPTEGKYSGHILGGIIIAYCIWAIFLTFPLVRRIYRAADAKFCTPEREIAAWRLDRATLAEYRRGMKRRFPWTWPFRIGLRSFRPGAKGYVQIRVYPEGVQIDGNLLPLSRAHPRNKFSGVHIAAIEIVDDPPYIEFLTRASRGRYNSGSKFFLPFPSGARKDAEKVPMRIGRGGLTSADSR